MENDPSHPAFDELLVLAWQQGVSKAGEQLAARWHPKLWRHARLLTRSADEASDVTQAAWVSITRNRTQLQDPARFAPWAYRIVTRRCADLARREQRQGFVKRALADSITPTATEPIGSNDSIREAFRSMTGHDRAILLLAHVDELPLRIIAEIFDLPVGTVKSRLHAARQRLRTKIESQEPDLGETHETARQ